MFLHLSVSHSVHSGGGLHLGGVCIQGGLHVGVCIWGESASSIKGVCIHRGVCICIQGVGVCIQGGWADPPIQILWDRVNERAVRTLLECSLVLPIQSSCTPAASNIGLIFWQYMDLAVFFPAYGCRNTFIFLGLHLNSKTLKADGSIRLIKTLPNI